MIPALWRGLRREKGQREGSQAPGDSSSLEPRPPERVTGSDLESGRMDRDGACARAGRWGPEEMAFYSQRRHSLKALKNSLLLLLVLKRFRGP